MFTPQIQYESIDKPDRSKRKIKYALIGAILITIAVVAVLNSEETQFQLKRARNILKNYNCPVGTFVMSPGSRGDCLCKKCPQGYKCNGGFYHKRKCRKGSYQVWFSFTWKKRTYVSNPGQKFPAACPKGSFQRFPGRRRCQLAPPGFYCPRKGMKYPYRCPAGQYSKKRGSIACIPASKGYFVPASGRTYQIKCARGRYQPKRGQRSCRLAARGYYVSLLGQKVQTPCPKGRFNPYRGQRTCRLASLGYYTPRVGMKNQLPCIKGSYQPRRGKSRCLPAMKGHYVPTRGSGYQRKCPRGTFQSLRGQRGCRRCPIGSFSNRPGSVTCQPASQGYFVGGVGWKFQRPCRRGTYQNKRGQRSCILARKNHYVPNRGAKSERKCPPGRFQRNRGRAGCLLIQCPAGSYNPAKSVVCKKAQPGYYCPRPGMTRQQACPRGYYSSGKGRTRCDRAVRGYYVPRRGMSKQIACKPGYFQPNHGKYFCIKAWKGHYVQRRGSFNQRPCPYGSYAPKRGSCKCVLADPGYYVPRRGYRNQFPCRKNFYAKKKGSRYCRRCPPGTISLRSGSKECQKRISEISTRRSYCENVCERRKTRAVQTGIYQKNVKKPFLMCAANFGKGLMGGYNVNHGKYRNTCTVGYGGKEISSNNYVCVCEANLLPLLPTENQNCRRSCSRRGMRPIQTGYFNNNKNNGVFACAVSAEKCGGKQGYRGGYNVESGRKCVIGVGNKEKKFKDFKCVCVR